nr:MAG TPA: hypothetical protein [Caudoviricetes sp.]
MQKSGTRLQVKSIYKTTKIRPGILTKSSRDTIGDFSTYPMPKGKKPVLNRVRSHSSICFQRCNYPHYPHAFVDKIRF